MLQNELRLGNCEYELIDSVDHSNYQPFALFFAAFIRHRCHIDLQTFKAFAAGRAVTSAKPKQSSERPAKRLREEHWNGGISYKDEVLRHKVTC